MERNARTGLSAGLSFALQRSLRNAAAIFLGPGVAFAPDLEIQMIGKRIDATHAYAVKAARDFVTVRIEFAAGMQFGHYDLSRGDAFFLMNTYRNTAAVIGHRNRVVDVDDDVDLVGVPGESLVHGIVNNLVHQVMQPAFSGGANIHGRPETHCLQAFQNFDTGLIVSLVWLSTFAKHIGELNTFIRHRHILPGTSISKKLTIRSASASRHSDTCL